MLPADCLLPEFRSRRCPCRHRCYLSQVPSFFSLYHSAENRFVAAGVSQPSRVRAPEPTFRSAVPLGPTFRAAATLASSRCRESRDPDNFLELLLTRIPGRGSRDPLLCVTGDGKLAVVYVYISHVAVFTCPQRRQTGGHVEVVAWEKTVFTIPAAVPYPPWVLPPKETWFHLSRGTMIAIYRTSAVSIVDLHRKALEKVMDCFVPLFKDKMNRTTVPYEMDLVDFFMLKLGGLSSAESSG
ncbi:hypothetical protein HU200_024651 [Digitaria exilis]|uniref:Uncharacterized protein n=1 Tax=Digitaria exilis TaxID=1010633 RepID=A0A835CAW4_9POAL|nr:hypothetical protein HU200_024651 [Digitaria exilis]